MSVVDTLRAAKELIKTPKQWVKFTRSMPHYVDFAPVGTVVAHCALGALDRARGYRLTDEQECMDAAVQTLALTIPDRSLKYVEAQISVKGLRPTSLVATYNNSAFTTHKDMMDWFDAAIAKAEAAESKALWKELVATPPVKEEVKELKEGEVLCSLKSNVSS